jgi:hypothetical protein
LLVTAIPIVISVVAFALSVFTWRERRQNDRRDLFLQLHERLVDRDVSRGMRILGRLMRSPEEAKNLFNDRPEDYEQIRRALSMLDLAAFYVERGYIGKSLFIEEWGAVYSNLLEGAMLFIAERERSGQAYNEWSWPHFQALANEMLTLSPMQDSRAAK